MGLKTLTKNISYVFIGRAVTTILSSISMIFLVRYLGPVQLGIYSFIITLLFFANTFSDFGISMYLTKEMAQDTDSIQHFFSNHLSIQLIFTLFTISFFLVFSMFLQGIERELLLLGIIGMLFNNFIFPFATVLSAIQSMKFLTITAIIAGLSSVLITFSGIYFHLPLTFFILLAISPSLINFIVVILLGKKHIKIKFEYDKTIITKVIKESLPFFALSATGLLSSRVDLIMLKMMQSNQATGIYNAAYKILFLIFIVPVALRSAIYPMLSNYHKNKKDKLIFIISKTIKYMLISATFISILIFLHANSIIYILFGDKFSMSKDCLKVLIWMFIPYCGYIVTMFYITAGGNVKYVMKISLLGLISNILMNLYLIPKYSALGASTATVITEIIIFFALMLKTLNEYKAVNSNNFIIKLCFISLSGVFIVLFLPYFYRGIFFILYFILLTYLMRIIDNDEKYVLKLIYKSFKEKLHLQ